MPENTLPAYEKAMSLGIGIECDLYLANDGIVFASHDYNLAWRQCGVDKLATNVVWKGELEFADAGRWKGPSWRGVHYPTLDQVLDLMERYPDLRHVLEIKDPRPQIWPIVASRVRAHSGLVATNLAFTGWITEQARKLLPEFDFSLVYSPQNWTKKDGTFCSSREVVNYLVWNKRKVFSPCWDRCFVTAELVAAVKKAGFRVETWTVDDPQEALEAFARGVDRIISNRPEKLLVEVNALLNETNCCWDTAWIEGRTPDGRQFFDPGEKMSFSLSLRDVKGRIPAGTYFIEWKRTGDDGMTDAGRVPLPLAEPLVVETALERPGFVCIEANVVDRFGKKVPKNHKWEKRVFFQGGAGVAPDRLDSAVCEPDDFDDYWAAQRKLLATTPIIETRKELTSENPKVRVFAVSVSCPGGRPMTGYMVMPRDASRSRRYPCQARFMGATHDPQAVPVKGFGVDDKIVMEINPHGYELCRPPDYYKKFFKKVEIDNDYYGLNVARNRSRDKTYYHGMALRAIRLLQYLKWIPEWDGCELTMYGGSQGGFQSMIAAANVSGLTKIMTSMVWGIDWGGVTVNRLLSSFRPKYDPALDYYDPAFHARRIRVPVDIFECGLGDYVSPPSTQVILYNNLAGPKRIVFKQGSTHGWWPKGVQQRTYEGPFPVTPGCKLAPYEMRWAGRTNDEHAVVAPMTDARHWRVKTHNAEARLVSARDRTLFGEGVLRVRYRATGDSPRVTLVPDGKVCLPPGADVVSLWIYGNNNQWDVRGDTPETDVFVTLEDASGQPLELKLAHIRHREWCVFEARVPKAQTVRFVKGGTVSSLEIRGGTNPDFRSLDLTSFCAWREKFRPVAFEPSPKRGVVLFSDMPQGLNTGAGRLSFPNRATTVIPVKEEDPELEFRFPDDPLRWEALAYRWKGGPWIPLAVGGGVRAAGDAALVRTKFRRVGDSVVAEVSAGPGALVTDVAFGKVAAAGRAVPLPYYTYREPVRSSRPSVGVVRDISGGVTFLTATVDWTQSGAFKPYAQTSSDREGMISLNGGTLYRRMTDGVMPSCTERFVWSVGRSLESVLPVIPHPASPFRETIASRLWWAHDAGIRTGSRYGDATFWRGMHRRGLIDLIVTDHETGWRDGEESFTLRTNPAPLKGGDRGQYDYARVMIDELGYLYGPYNNFVDICPVNAHWSVDRVSRSDTSELVPTWYRCYLIKPDWAVAAAKRIPPIIQRKFSFTAAYCDVHTAGTPWGFCDYDSRSPGACTFSQTYYDYGEIMLEQRKTWNGPVFSEGGSHWFYAGLNDGNYASDAEYHFDEAPWIVDFDLRRLHPLTANFGFGSLDQPKDRLLAGTIAFGHGGNLHYAREDMMRHYFLLQAIQTRYVRANARRIAYGNEHDMLEDTDLALQTGAYQMSHVFVRYDDGTEVAVNGKTNGTFVVEVGGVTYALPPYGFAAASGDGKVRVFSGEANGRRAEWVTSESYVYVNGRGTPVRFPCGGADGIVVRIPEKGGEEVIVEKCSRVELPYEATSVLALDETRNVVGARAFSCSGGWTTIRVAPDDVSYRLVFGKR